MNIKNSENKSISTVLLDLIGVHYECVKQLLSSSKMTVEVTESKTMEKKDLILFFIKDPTRWAIAFTSVIVLAMFFGTTLVEAPKTKCADFDSQVAAQKAFDKNKKKYASLDRGGVRGVVCESYNYHK